MKKQWYMICIGYDIGDAESGPIFRTEYDAVKARSLAKAKQRAEALVRKTYTEGCEGYSVYPAKESDMEMIARMMGQSAEMSLWDRFAPEPDIAY